MLAVVEDLNRDNNVDGILISFRFAAGRYQAHPRSRRSRQGLDGSTPSISAASSADVPPVACTPAAVWKFCAVMKSRSKRQRRGPRRSDIVGKPMALLLMHANATVQFASKTRDLPDILRRADIIAPPWAKPATSKRLDQVC